MRLFKFIIKLLLIIFSSVAVLAVVALVFFTANAYRPDDIESVNPGNGSEILNVGDTITVMTYNIGYGSMGQNAYLFMNNGISSTTTDQTTIERNLDGIAQEMSVNPVDIYLLQEVDTNSSRSFNINQLSYFEESLEIGSSFAYNLNCIFVPYPIPFIGHVESGISILTDFIVNEAYRISLPTSSSWPLSTCSPKQCLLVNRIPVDNSDKELIIINLQFDSYGDSYEKYEQFYQLKEVIAQEYLKGNYIIAGGDFSYLFPNTEQSSSGADNYWNPSSLTENDLPADFQYVTDTSVASYRLLHSQGDSDLVDAQYYVVDGFIVSSNLLVESVKTLATDFEYSDHQPVIMSVTLK